MSDDVYEDIGYKRKKPNQGRKPQSLIFSYSLNLEALSWEYKNGKRIDKKAVKSLPAPLDTTDGEYLKNSWSDLESA